MPVHLRTWCCRYAPHNAQLYELIGRDMKWDVASEEKTVELKAAGEPGAKAKGGLEAGGASVGAVTAAGGAHSIAPASASSLLLVPAGLSATALGLMFWCGLRRCGAGRAKERST